MIEPTLAVAPFQLPPLVIPDAVTAEIDRLLAVPALMAKCVTAAENKAVFDARRDLENLSRSLEKSRKLITDPVNDWLRRVKAIVDTAKEPLDREAGRLAELEKEFRLAEDRRIREEQEAQRRELERIEAEKRAEVARLAREQAEREAAARREQEEAARRVREAQELAERAAREATNKKQREIAEKARQAAAAEAEAIRLRKEAEDRALAEQRAANDAAIAAAQETADAQAAIAAKPVDRVRATGQTARKVWKIVTINDHLLYKSRPDLVRKFEWDLAGLKQALDDSGGKLPGVTAEEDYSMGARGGKRPSFIEA